MDATALALSMGSHDQAWLSQYLGGHRQFPAFCRCRHGAGSQHSAASWLCVIALAVPRTPAASAKYVAVACIPGYYPDYCGIFCVARAAPPEYAGRRDAGESGARTAVCAVGHEGFF